MTRPAADTILVTVKNGTVTLSGEVARMATRREGARIAATVQGVKQVDNELRVPGRVFPVETLPPPNEFYYRSDFFERPGVERR